MLRAKKRENIEIAVQNSFQKISFFIIIDKDMLQ